MAHLHADRHAGFAGLRPLRPLRRDPRHGWIAGVCAGIAQALAIDPAFVRTTVIVIGLFLPKITLATYLVAWLLLEDGRGR